MIPTTTAQWYQQQTYNDTNYNPTMIPTTTSQWYQLQTDNDTNYKPTIIPTTTSQWYHHLTEGEPAVEEELQPGPDGKLISTEERMHIVKQAGQGDSAQGNNSYLTVVGRGGYLCVKRVVPPLEWEVVGVWILSRILAVIYCQSPC